MMLSITLDYNSEYTSCDVAGVNKNLPVETVTDPRQFFSHDVID